MRWLVNQYLAINIRYGCMYIYICTDKYNINESAIWCTQLLMIYFLNRFISHLTPWVLFLSGSLRFAPPSNTHEQKRRERCGNRSYSSCDWTTKPWKAMTWQFRSLLFCWGFHTQVHFDSSRSGLKSPSAWGWTRNSVHAKPKAIYIYKPIFWSCFVRGWRADSDHW